MIPKYLSESGDLLSLPKVLSLTDSHIAAAGNVEEIERMCHDVCELDLTKNALTNWEEILKILERIPGLNFLNLTSNDLQSTLQLGSDDLCFPTVNHLVVNNTGVTWSTVDSLLQLFPELTELHLSLNNYTNIDFSLDEPYSALKTLHFNGNNVHSYHEICKIGYNFPNMERFVMTENNISSIQPEDVLPDAFPSLQCLNLNKTPLQDWQELDKLRKFPKLKDVRLLKIPCFETLDDNLRRQLQIARLPNLTHLNGSRIAETEREDAERAFIRHYMDKDDNHKPQRYYELERVYGKLDPLVELDLKPKTHFSVTVQFESEEKKIKVDTNKTVAQLKKSLEEFVGVPPSKFRLFYVAEEYYNSDSSGYGSEEMKYGTRQLYRYNINNGDYFLVVLK
ncbi:hypothetical protein LOTGIDRAFT_104573 [Lottia gigantea]|uniref:Ubiquitin-like domain-containing protein n=1 Tax=Lottia gigantea TaxID=225164 RepID=V4AFH6_LOTGI|nr:hypothetical protein LOTGIDRAFT_104573 [Lottia gigantea]ESO93855.1 hypothetical protein LOTGIDRAFT_104573 [Lottia gigantea]